MGASQSGTRDASAKARVEMVIASAPIVVFSSASCRYCARAINTLISDGYNEPMLKVIEASSMQRKTLLEMTGVSTVPSIWIRGVYVGGCNDGPLAWMGLMKLRENGDLQKLLNGESKI